MAKAKTKAKEQSLLPDREYLMKVSGGLVRHLGLQMYSGAVPAIGELVSNAWDAMAQNVWIDIPLDKPITEDDEITVRDDGHGMTHEECNQEYLLIGRDRRREEGDYSRPYKRMKRRRLQSRKGIGKLAGFGIAHTIEVRTIADGDVSHFALNYDDIVRNKGFVDAGGYKAQIERDDGRTTRKRPGTLITLKGLKISRAVREKQFMESMARRFAIIGQKFKVHVNGKEVTREEVPFQFRFPERRGSWENVELPNGQQIKWWAGFTKKPIPNEETRGFVVYVRGKLAQAPWFFELSGGAWGQHGLQYLTGEISADFLDATDGQDLVATDRGAIRWEDPLAQPLKEWGVKNVRSLLEQWTDRRREKKSTDPHVQRYLELAQKLPERERSVFKSFVDKITSIPQVDEDKDGRDILVDLVEFGYNALTNRSFIDIIKQLNAVAPEDVGKLNEALAEWDIIEAVTIARLVRGRVEILRKFRDMVEGKVPEKPDMQEYLKAHPWLIDPGWSSFQHEQQLDTIVQKYFKLPKPGTGEDRKRLDYFCLGDRYKIAHVVELKRPGDSVGRDELDQLRDYVLYLRDKLIDSATDEKYKRSIVVGLLVCSKIKPSDESHAEMYQQTGVLEIRNWDNLLTMSEQLHQEFLEAVRLRASSDDPRMQELDQVAEKRKRKKTTAKKKASAKRTQGRAKMKRTKQAPRRRS